MKTGRPSHPIAIAQAVGREAQAKEAAALARAEAAETRLAQAQEEIARLHAESKPASAWARLFNPRGR